MAFKGSERFVFAVICHIIDVDFVVVRTNCDPCTIRVVLDRFNPLFWIVDYMLDVVQLDIQVFLSLSDFIEFVYQTDCNSSVVVSHS